MKGHFELIKFKKEVKNIHIDGSIDYLYLNKT
jgi:hypothetical protein